MVPSDNIFNIYYDIGRALPFEVQRFPKDATDWYKNQSVLVTEIHTRGKYGEALGFYLWCWSFPAAAAPTPKPDGLQDAASRPLSICRGSRSRN